MLDPSLKISCKIYNALTVSLTLLLCLLSASMAQAQVTLSTTSLGFGSVVLNQVSGIQSVTIKNNQAAPLQNLTFTLPTLTLYALAPSGTTCVSGSSLTPGSSCIVGLTFNPKSGSIPATSALTVNTAGGTAQRVPCRGQLFRRLRFQRMLRTSAAWRSMKQAPSKRSPLPTIKQAP